MAIAPLFALLMIFFASISTCAQPVQIGQVDLVQFLLIWTGDYSGMVDGVIGPLTERAVRSFLLRRFGRVPQSFSGREIDALIDEAGVAVGAAGFVVHRDWELGVTYGIPEAIVHATDSRDENHLSFRSPDRTVEIEIANLRQKYGSVSELHRKLSSIPGRDVAYSAVRPTWFVMSGKDREKNFYVRYHQKGSEIRGFSVSYSASRVEEMAPIVTAMSNVFRASPGANDPLVAFLEGLPSLEDGSTGTGAVANGEEHRGTYSGTGFAISTEGTIVTNAHVVEDCRAIEVRDEAADYGEVSVLALDADADLAILRLPGRKPNAAAQIQTRPPELGQEVVILGYPLSDLMGDAVSVTTGLISSLSGLGGNRSFHTLTANIQPGNSGGPVLDMNGHVIAVAVAKFNEQKMLQTAGTTGANIGFAISAKTLLDFLGPFKISETAEEAGDELSVQAIAAQAKDFTVQVVCRN